MKITYCFNRRAPFGDVFDDDPPNELLERYRARLAEVLGPRFSAHRVEVEVIEEGARDVEFDPPGLVAPEEELEIALEIKRRAAALRDEMVMEHYRERRDAANDGPEAGGGE